MLQPTDVEKLAAHIDFFPTLAEFAGAKLSDHLRNQVEGRSLVPLLKSAQADWPDRTLVTHVGRWPKGAAPAKFKYASCSIRNSQFQLVSQSKGEAKNWQLFDLKTDLAQKTDVAAKHPAVVQQLDAEYDRWWDSVQPQLVNEDAIGPNENPFKVLFEKQFGKAMSVMWPEGTGQTKGTGPFN
jgi:arylsulfatase